LTSGPDFIELIKKGRKKEDNVRSAYPYSPLVCSGSIEAILLSTTKCNSLILRFNPRRSRHE
jgi:hypothetical protein